MSDYVAGTNITLFANYVNSNQTPILAGISGNSIDIYHYELGGSKVIDVLSGTVTQNPDDPNRYFYQHAIPSGATLTTHIVEFSAIFSGTEVQSTESFGVLPFSSTFPIPGLIGSIAASGSVVNFSGSGIANATVLISLFSNPNNASASTVTNSSGLYTVFLDPEDYLITVNADGFLTNQVAKTIPSGTPTFNFGQITLSADSNSLGSLVLSDQFGRESGGFLSNLKVSLFSKGVSSTAQAPPIAVTRTNVSGVFFMNANPGEFVLVVEGVGNSGRVFNTSYNIEVSDAYATASPQNFRYRGTSQFNFLI